MIKAQFERKGATIKNLETNESQSFTYKARERNGVDSKGVQQYKTVERPSVNAAKRESRKIQGSNLGSGILRLG